jgi:signal transduction histidine kinase/HAMP domain-containing protein
MFRLRLNAKLLLLVLGSLVVYSGVLLYLHSRLDRFRLVLFILASLAFFGGLLYLAVRKIVTKPLAALQDAAARVGSGDLSFRVEMRTGDEFQDLAMKFNASNARIEGSYSDLERVVAERSVQLHHTMADLSEKASRLYTYSRNMAAISRISAKVIDAEMTLDELLDQFMEGITRGLGYKQMMICLVDRKRMRLDIKRDTGIRSILPFEDGSLMNDNPLIRLVRSARVETLSSALFMRAAGGDGAPQNEPDFFFIPLLNRRHNKPCWQTTSCIKTGCPAYQPQKMPCWNIEGTHCGNPLRETTDNKLAYCLACRVFPVIGALVVAFDRQNQSTRNRNISVLRILASQTAAALENHRLHTDNQQMVRDLLELHRVTATALTGLSLVKALEVFTESAMKFSGLDACAFWLLSPDSRELVRKSGGCIDGGNLSDLCPERVPADEGILGRALLQRPSLVIDYNVPGNDSTQLGRAAAGHRLQSILAIPLKSEGRPLGVFSVLKRSSTPFLETEIAAFMLLANQASMAIDVCILNEELKSRNRDLERHTNLVSGILSSMSSGIMLLDRHGVVSLINQVGAGILRARRDDLLNKSLTGLFPETAAFLQPGEGPYREIEIQINDGTAVPVGYSSTMYRGTAGEQEGTIVVYRDLTEIKTLQAELLSKERFAAMGRIIAGVAHEIRNPLFGISSIGQVLQRELPSPTHQKLMRALLSETFRMNNLIEELLLYGRPIKLNLESCNLTKIWGEVIAVHRDELDQKGIRITGDLHSGHMTARVDANQIRQVLLNLLRNALDASRTGGEINIRFIQESPSIVFRITDTGFGIPAKSMDRLFDLFFTTKQKGTGLGLAICKKIVQDHGGTITVVSEEGAGTAVTVRLPARMTALKQDSAGARD